MKNPDEIQLPVLEIKELINEMVIGTIGALPTPITENILFEFSDSMIRATLTRTICSQICTVDYPCPEELIGKRFLLPFKQIKQLLSLGIDDVELILINSSIKYINGKTVVTMQLEDVSLYPRVEHNNEDILTTISSDDLRELLSVKNFCFSLNGNPAYEYVLFSKEDGYYRTFVYAHSSMPSVRIKAKDNESPLLLIEVLNVVASAILLKAKKRDIYISKGDNEQAVFFYRKLVYHGTLRKDTSLF